MLAATAFEVLKKAPTSSPQSADADKDRVETLRFVEIRTGPQEPQAEQGPQALKAFKAFKEIQV